MYEQAFIDGPTPQLQLATFSETRVNDLTEGQPTLENYWRAVILFGRNVASYKFALGKSLLEFASQSHEINLQRRHRVSHTHCGIHFRPD